MAAYAPLIEEQEEKYVNYPRIYRHYLNDGKRIIWSSERDNYNHLYLYDRATASPINQITKGEWYVREVQYVDEANQQIYFSANGVNKDEDPYLIHYYRIGFDGKGMKELTPEEGMHKAWYSSDHKYLVDVYSKVDQAPVAVLRNAANGKVLMELEKADISKTYRQRLESSRSILRQRTRRQDRYVGHCLPPVQLRRFEEIPCYRIHLLWSGRPVRAQDLLTLQRLHVGDCRTGLHRGAGRRHDHFVPLERV